MPRFITGLFLTTGFLSAAIVSHAPADETEGDSRQPRDETRLLSNVRQLIFEGQRSGEGYFSADGSRMIFQSEREPGNPLRVAVLRLVIPLPTPSAAVSDCGIRAYIPTSWVGTSSVCDSCSTGHCTFGY